ncbi:MAG: phosphoribosylformylglycinamidine synthase [Deltaproteobacteria bacterium]|nr:MAG: phosphoribosylformylglycinamidine synthase [Deltaproteobacteria bacterium]
MDLVVTQLYRKIDADKAYCFNIESSRPLRRDETDRLKRILADGFEIDSVDEQPPLRGARLVEIGPRLNFATAWSSNMVSICRATGLDSISRIERSRCYLVPEDQEKEQFIAAHHDRMTECPYPQTLSSFATGIVPEAVYEVDLLAKGPDELCNLPGVSMDARDRELYYDYFVRQQRRNPTIVEIMDLNNANSEHSRHGFFRGRQIIDGEEMEQTLFELVTATLAANPEGSLIAFKDNSSAVTGYQIETIVPAEPGKPSAFIPVEVEYNPLLTAETHNFPTGVAPFPGAETGTGGRIRDVLGTGRGAFVIAGTAGYCVGNLNIPGYSLAWEKEEPIPENLARPLDIEIQASNGASDYGNKFGEPVVQGFTRSFDLRLESGERWGFVKPIMFTAGIGQLDSRHTEKAAAEKGMLIVQIGGPAYRVGFGGGAASSMLQGENESSLDYNAVQRGDAEMEQKLSRVIRACNEMGGKTLIDVIHDQGAGGPANVLKELVEESGGRVEIRNIRLGDPTMSVLEIYVAEYQERVGLLIHPENIAHFKEICQREKVGCEVLGEVTGDLRFVVHDAENNSTPVDIDIPALLGEIPQKVFEDRRIPMQAGPLRLPADLSFSEALGRVLRLVSVGSKRFLTNKVDRSVTGLVAQQQCCGPLQLTVGNVAVVAQSHFGLTGIATAIGEQPLKMLLDPSAGARMTVGECLTNLVWARVEGLERVKCSANWMWAPKLDGEGAALYDAASAMCRLMTDVGMAVDGGKDSLSMATMVGDEVVKSPRQLVISAYVPIRNITRLITPDLKAVGSDLIFIDLAADRNRLGGSALAQVYRQLGEICPDVDDSSLLVNGFLAIQKLIDRSLLRAGHDRSDGGLITTLLEMAFSGNCGLQLNLEGRCSVFEKLFSEELGCVVECDRQHTAEVCAILSEYGLEPTVIGKTTEEKRIQLVYNDQLVLDEEMPLLRSWWEETSYQLERLQMNPLCAEEERQEIYDRKGPVYTLPFSPEPFPAALLSAQKKPKVAILRDEGSNSDREMTAAFYAAGFEPWDICMQDLLTGTIDLQDFRGLAAVGGFSYADVPESAKGWAATIAFNPRLQQLFTDFYQREDTFSLGVCNGCQLFALLGWVPWPAIAPEKQPRFVANRSGRFESRWTTVKVLPSKAVMLRGMEGLVFGIHVDHGEGRLSFPDRKILEEVEAQGMVPMVYADDAGEATEKYPFNPNGSVQGLAGLCSSDGRHLALMPHPERAFLAWQAHYLPETLKGLEVTPWMQMFRNAYLWCVKNEE